MRKVVGFWILSALLLSSAALAQAPDNCLFIFPDSLSPLEIHISPDSIARDTCSASSTYNHWYSKRYGADFKVNAFHLGYARPDSILIVHWYDIDTIYSALRDSFHSIFNKWGNYYFQKIHPEDTSFAYDGFKIIFDNYLLADGGVFDDLEKIQGDGLVEIHFPQTPEIPDFIPNVKVIITSMSVVPNPFINKTEFRFSLAYTQGLHLEIYDVLGRKLLIKDLGIRSSGNQKYELNTSNWPQGSYYARFISTDGKVYTVSLKRD